MQRHFSLCLFLIVSFAPATRIEADIYRQVRDDGVISFTDTPASTEYALVMRERQSTLPKKRTVKHQNSPKLLNDPLPPMSLDTDHAQLPVAGRISSSIGLRYDPFDGRLKHHSGMDIACPSGSPVKPVAAGSVSLSGFRPGYGNIVIVDHQDATTTLYAHNSQNFVQTGDLVSTDTVIAHTGSTGRSTGPHLHFEAWRNGINITAAFLPGSSGQERSQHQKPEAPIRRTLLADGSLAFTNLP